MRNVKKAFTIKKFLNIILTTMMAGCLLYGIVNITYAAVNQADPDVTVTVGRGGHISQNGNLFGSAVWYPGYEKSGIIRVHSAGGLTISRLGLNVLLDHFRPDYNKQTVYDSFINNMRLTIKKGNLLVFSSIIVDDKSLAELASGNGIALEGLNRLLITAGGFTDLEYTLRMDYEAGKELQEVSAKVAFQINMSESPGSDIPEKTDPENKDTKPQDITGHWAHNCIDTLLEHNILDTYKDGTIKPENFITRAETAVLAGKALKLENKTTVQSSYIDPVPEWAKGYIISTTEAGIFKGYPGNRFMPENKILREEMTAVLIRSFKKDLKEDFALQFSDKNRIGRWALDYIKAAVQNQIITGYPDNTFKPKNYMTRAEAFTIICKLLGYHKDH